MNKKKTYKITVEMEMDFRISEDEDDFQESDNFEKIAKDIVVDCLEHNASNIKIIKQTPIKKV